MRDKKLYDGNPTSSPSTATATTNSDGPAQTARRNSALLSEHNFDAARATAEEIWRDLNQIIAASGKPTLAQIAGRLPSRTARASARRPGRPTRSSLSCGRFGRSLRPPYQTLRDHRLRRRPAQTGRQGRHHPARIGRAAGGSQVRRRTRNDQRRRPAPVQASALIAAARQLRRPPTRSATLGAGAVCEPARGPGRTQADHPVRHDRHRHGRAPGSRARTSLGPDQLERRGRADHARTSPQTDRQPTATSAGRTFPRRKYWSRSCSGPSAKR